ILILRSGRRQGYGSTSRSDWTDNGKPLMTVKLYAFTCGTLTGEFAHLMEGGEGRHRADPGVSDRAPERPGVVQYWPAHGLPTSPGRTAGPAPCRVVPDRLQAGREGQR